MPTKPEILSALQFSHMHANGPINTTADSRHVITYQFATTSAPGDLPTSGSFSGWTAYTAAEKAALGTAFAHIETFLNVDFVQVSGAADPDLNLGKVTLPGATAGVGGNSISTSGGSIVRWDGFVVYDNLLDLSAGSRLPLILHELGHALGLKHPFSGDSTLPASQDSNKYSIMSYTANPDNGKDSNAMMLYDVFALQDIWGAAANAAGNTVYSGPRNSTVDAIWDSGGIDELDASAYSNGVSLDLRPGFFSAFGSYEDMVITYGTWIENAAGGAGADTLTGNSLMNILSGGGGADLILGGDGADTLSGDSGDDDLLGQNGHDSLSGHTGSDALSGGDGNDTLRGGWGADHAWGGNGDDQLFGELHNDSLWGGNGHDRISGQNGADQSWGGGGNDLQWGGNGADRIWGQGGDDQSWGGAGNDQLWGGDGNDRLFGLGQNDQLWGGNGNDTLWGGDGFDKLWGGNGADSLNGRQGADWLTGNAGKDSFIFARGDGNDRVLDFQNNVDSLVFQGLGSKSDVLSHARNANGNVIFDFAGGDSVTVENTTLAQVSDDILT